MQRLGHAGLVGVPEQQIEGGRRLAHQVVGHEERPDQVVGPEGIEGLGHGCAGQHAAGSIHLLLDLAQPVLVGEQQQVAGLGEVVLGGEEGVGGDPLVALRRHMGQGRAHQGAADAVADGVDVLGLRLLQRLLDAAVDALFQIIVEAEAGLVDVRIDPGADEDGEALAGQPADHRVLGLQVQDVEFVDPWREDQQRNSALFVGGGVELDQFEQLVTPDDLAGRGGDVLADDEFAVVGLADLQLAGAALHVGGEILHPLHQRFAVAVGQGLEGDRVGGEEVGRGEGVGQQFGEELGTALGQGVDVLDAGDEAVHPVRGDQIGLAHDVEGGVLGPGGVLETLVLRGCCGGLLAGGTAGRGRPQVHVAVEQVGLGGEQLVRTRGQAGHDRIHGRADMEGVGRQGRRAVGLGQGGLGDGRLGRHGGLGQVHRQGLQHLPLVVAGESEGVGGGGFGFGQRRRRRRRFGGRGGLGGAGPRRLGRGGASGLARRAGRRFSGRGAWTLGHGELRMSSGTVASAARALPPVAIIA